MLKVNGTVQPKSHVIQAAFGNVAEDMGLTLRLTSGNDSTHMPGSKHYAGQALDFGCKEFPADVKREIVGRVQTRLGKGYQVFIEHEGEPNEHIHCEYDPR